MVFIKTNLSSFNCHNVNSKFRLLIMVFEEMIASCCNYAYVYTYICTYVFMYIHAYIRTYVSMYTSIYTDNPPLMSIYLEKKMMPEFDILNSTKSV